MLLKLSGAAFAPLVWNVLASTHLTLLRSGIGKSRHLSRLGERRRCCEVPPELLTETPVSLDLAAGHVRVRWTLARVDRKLVFDEPKTERSRRFVSLPSPVVEVLRRHRASLAAERLAALAWAPWEDHEDLVFPTHIGTPTDPRNALRAFEGIAERAGLTGVGLHTLRHSAASALIASGAHIKVVQELLGHSSYGITADIYSHVAIEQQREAAQRLGEAFPW
jgi:integrase